MKATSGRGSSWDESDSESEAEIVRTIHTSDAPSTHAMLLRILDMYSLSLVKPPSTDFPVAESIHFFIGESGVEAVELFYWT